MKRDPKWVNAWPTKGRRLTTKLERRFTVWSEDGDFFVRVERPHEVLEAVQAKLTKGEMRKLARILTEVAR